jgi:hypothetical protein
MLLSDFQNSLSLHGPEIRRAELQTLFEAASLPHNKAEQATRFLSIVWALHPDPRPLWFWADDRCANRIPHDPALPYNIRLGAFLLPSAPGGYSLSIWEIADRDHFIRALDSREFVPAPFSPETTILEMMDAPAPTHALYPDDPADPFFGPDIPFRFNAAAVDRHEIAQTRLVLNPLQPALLAMPYVVNPAIAR